MVFKITHRCSTSGSAVRPKEPLDTDNLCQCRGQFEYKVMATVEILNNPGNPYHSTTTLKWGNVDADSDPNALVV